MKLESTLKLRPDFLFVAPLLNVVLLLLIFFLVTSSLVVQGGSRVELPSSPSTLRPLEKALVLIVTAQRPTPPAVKPVPVKQSLREPTSPATPPVNPEPIMYLNKEKVTLQELPARLSMERSISRLVIIHADVLVSHGRVIELENIIWEAGCQPAIATSLPP